LRLISNRKIMKGKRLMKTIGFDEAESKEEGSTSNGLQTSSGEVHGNRSPFYLPDANYLHCLANSFFFRRKRRLHTYERVHLAYKKIQREKEIEKERKRIQRENRQKAMANYKNMKRKMDRAVMKKNKKGQPNLNAQIEVLLEKIEKRLSK
uniref:40S ribosomal protein S6 n=1 Tax=Dracunculus medinensis TaxID=318479 RepID=A0A0N4UFB8_DRAME